MKTIFAAIDFSPVSRRVVAEGERLAKTFDGRLVLFHSVPPPVIISDLAPLMAPAFEFTDDVRKAAARHLRRLADAIARRGIPVQTVATNGHPVTQLLDHLTKLAADYIVLGSHGHTAIYDLVAGSVASGVLKHASCPVVVIPPLRKRARDRASKRAAARAVSTG